MSRTGALFYNFNAHILHSDLPGFFGLMKRASSSLVLAAGLWAAFASSALAAGGTDAVMRSLDQVNRIYTPEKNTHTELLLRLNELGCHYRVNNRMLADPEDIMKHTFGWFYRMLPDDRGIANCFPVTVFFQNKDDGRDVIEIDGGAGGDRKALLSALKKRWGEPLVTKGRRHKAAYWVFNAGDRTIVLKEMGILRNYEIEIQPVSYYDAVKRALDEERAKAEAEKQAAEAAAALAASSRKAAEDEAREREQRITRAREAARTHVGRLFGIVTPGDTDMLVAKAEAEAQGCRILKDGALVRADSLGRLEPCFILPGRPALSVEQFKGGLGFMVRYEAQSDGVKAMRAKLASLGPVASYETRGAVNHYWQDAGMTVVETGHERPNSPVSFLFISKATFENELARILQEKAEAEAERQREAQTLQKMF